MWTTLKLVPIRTTIMLRNIPNRVDFQDLELFLDATSEGQYDFSYLRIDISNNLKVVETFRKSTHTPKSTYSQNNFTCVFVSKIFLFKLPSSQDQVTDCLCQDTMSRPRARHLRPSARRQSVQHVRRPQQHIDQEATTRRATASARRQHLQDGKQLRE
jgi:hypothetical protein